MPYGIAHHHHHPPSSTKSLFEFGPHVLNQLVVASGCLREAGMVFQFRCGVVKHDELGIPL